MESFLEKYFKTSPNPDQKNSQNSPLQNYLDYLLGRQKYAISTINACAGVPVLGALLGIYRHAYIQIYDSPFKNNRYNNEVLELNPTGLTDENKNNVKIHSRVKIVPGIVTMALHLAGKELLDTGNYNLKHYRPWRNDCQTYLKHAQERMNEKLKTGSLQQQVIDHLRFSPNFSKKDIIKMRKAFGVKNCEHILKVTEKGLNIAIPEQALEHNFRNVIKNRNVKDKPTRGWLKYYSWLMKQFATDILDRLFMHSLYKRAKKSKPEIIAKVFDRLEKVDGLTRGICNAILLDMTSLAKKPNSIKSANFHRTANNIIQKKNQLLNTLSELSIDLIYYNENRLSEKAVVSRIKALRNNIHRVSFALKNLHQEIHLPGLKLQGETKKLMPNIAYGMSQLKALENSLKKLVDGNELIAVSVLQNGVQQKIYTPKAALTRKLAAEKKLTPLDLSKTKYRK